MVRRQPKWYRKTVKLYLSIAKRMSAVRAIERILLSDAALTFEADPAFYGSG
jgi:hypothetical protein